AAFVREHAGLVWQTAYRLLGNHADAADCFQEAFVPAWDASSRQKIANWPGFLQRATTRRALNRLRQRRRAARGRDAIELNLIPHDSDPLSQAQDAELAAQLRAALATLPWRQSEAYCLRHLSDMSYEQIGA